MMFAHAVEFYILHYNYLRSGMFEHGFPGYLHRVDAITLRDVDQGFGGTHGGLYESLAVGILSYQAEYLAVVPGNLFGELRIVSLFSCHI